LRSVTLNNAGILISLISPFDTIYRKTVAVIFSSQNLVGSFTGPIFVSGAEPSAWMMLYAALYAVLFIYLAIRKFNHRDI